MPIVVCRFWVSLIHALQTGSFLRVIEAKQQHMYRWIRSYNFFNFSAGLLAAPQNLKADSITSTTIHLTWVSPFSLDITGIDPDITSYVIYIRNTNTGNISTVSLSETEYTFTRQDFRNCDNFEFSVLAMNGVGEGNMSDTVIATFLGRKLIQPLLIALLLLLLILGLNYEL